MTPTAITLVYNREFRILQSFGTLSRVTRIADDNLALQCSSCSVNPTANLPLWLTTIYEGV